MGSFPGVSRRTQLRKRGYVPGGRSRQPLDYQKMGRQLAACCEGFFFRVVKPKLPNPKPHPPPPPPRNSLTTVVGVGCLNVELETALWVQTPREGKTLQAEIVAY